VQIKISRKQKPTTYGGGEIEGNGAANQSVVNREKECSVRVILAILIDREKKKKATAAGGAKKNRRGTEGLLNEN